MINKFIQSKINKYLIGFIAFVVITIPFFKFLMNQNIFFIMISSFFISIPIIEALSGMKSLLDIKKIYNLVINNLNKEVDLLKLEAYLKPSRFSKTIEGLDDIINNIIFLFYFKSKNYFMALEYLKKSEKVLLDIPEVDELLYNMNTIRLKSNENIIKIKKILDERKEALLDIDKLLR